MPFILPLLHPKMRLGAPRGELASTASVFPSTSRQIGCQQGHTSCRTRPRPVPVWHTKCEVRRMGIDPRKEENMKLQNLRDLFVSELRDLYNAENQLVKALPKMASSASSEKLQAAFEEHLEQTKNHVTRLESVFEKLNLNPKG